MLTTNEFLETLPELGDGKKVVSILSGGLDSSTLTGLLVKKYGADNVFALTYNYGQRLDYEIQCAQKICEKFNVKHRIIDISFFGEIVKDVCSLAHDGLDVPHIEDTLGDPQCPTYVPFRNQLLLSLGFTFAEANNAEYIFYGAQGQDVYQYWDTTPEFVERLNAVADLNRKHKIEIKAPFIPFSKEEEVIWGTEIGIDYADTWTCYNGPDKDGKACGTCPGCSDRIQHFMKAGIKDGIEYKNKIDWEAGFKQFQ